MLLDDDADDDDACDGSAAVRLQRGRVWCACRRRRRRRLRLREFHERELAA